MAQSFISSLPSSLRNAWSLVTKGVAEGLSANRIQSALKAAGMGVRRQTLLDGIRYIREGFKSDKTLRLLKPTFIPPISQIPVSATPLRRTYSYIMRITYERGGQLVTQYVTLSTDDLLSKQDALDLMSDLYDNDAFQYGEQRSIIGADVTGIRRSA